MGTEQDAATAGSVSDSAPGSALVLEIVRRDPLDYANFRAAWNFGIRRQVLRGFFRRIDPVEDFETRTKSAADSGLLESIVFGYIFEEKPIGVKNEIHKWLGLDVNGYLTYLVAPYIIASNSKDQSRSAEYFGLLGVDELGYRPVKSQSYREIILAKCLEMNETFKVPVQSMHFIG